MQIENNLAQEACDFFDAVVWDSNFEITDGSPG